jgi:hypothetical protein
MVMTAGTGMGAEPVDHVQGRQRGARLGEIRLDVRLQQQILRTSRRVGGSDISEIGVALITSEIGTAE